MMFINTPDHELVHGKGVLARCEHICSHQICMPDGRMYKHTKDRYRPTGRVLAPRPSSTGRGADLAGLVPLDAAPGLLGPRPATESRPPGPAPMAAQAWRLRGHPARCGLWPALPTHTSLTDRSSRTTCGGRDAHAAT